jgi:hypothetical protein
MMLEAAAHTDWPYFVTLTYREETLPKITDASAKARRFAQYAKRKNFQCRYFICTELGERTARVHHHGIVWLEGFNALSQAEIDRTKLALWPYGHSQIVPCRSARAIGYVAKYVQKPDKFGERENNERVRGYQWSRRPELGAEKIIAWRAHVRAQHAVNPFTQTRKIPAYIRANVLGQASTIRVPDADLTRMYQELGVQSYEPEETRLLEGVPTGPIDWSKMHDLLKNRADLSLSSLGQLHGYDKQTEARKRYDSIPICGDRNSGSLVRTDTVPTGDT